MVLYTLQVPDPPAGEDWQTVVPGLKVYDVTGITAQLDTAGVSDILQDVSGNGNNGLYMSPTPFGDFVPGLLAGVDAWTPGAPPGSSAFDAAEIPHRLCDFTAPFTLAWWQRYDVADLGGGTAQLISFSPGPLAEFQIVGTATNGAPGSQPLVVLVLGSSWIAPASVLVTGTGAHHVALVFDGGTTLDLYVDGVAVPWAATGTPGTLNVADSAAFGNPDIGAGTFQAYAVFPTDLSAGDIASLFAAGAGGIATYTPAVDSFNPDAYYLFDGVGGGTGRTPGLAVTDGNHETVLIGDGFAAQSTPGPYGYSWQPQQPTNARGADGVLTTVGIPRLILPGGYTLGTRTPDLLPTDQWTDIVVWYDDTYGRAVDPAGRYDYGRGAHLVYQQIGAQP